MELSDKEADKIEARAEAATPGPWGEDPEGIGYVMGGDPTDIKTNVITSDRSLDDLVFIALARTDVPKLLANRKELKAVISKLEEYIIELERERDTLSYKAHEAAEEAKSYREGHEMLINDIKTGRLVYGKKSKNEQKT